MIKQLVDHNIDGIIVLTSVPEVGKSESAIENETDDIIKVVTYLKEQAGTRCFPIAYGLTKWDLRWKDIPTPPNALESEVERLDAFFKERNEYKTVRNIITGYAGERSKVFPLSALGKCHSGVNNQLLPTKVPLQSYGLPFVFGWIIKTVNELESQQFDEMNKELQKRHWLLLPKTTAVTQFHQLADKLLKRLPLTADWKQKRIEIREGRGHILFHWWSQFTAVMLLCVLFIVLISSFHLNRRDTQMLMQAETAIDSTLTQEDELHAIDRKLSTYINSLWSPWQPLRRYSEKKKAKDMLAKIWERNESIFYAGFESLPLSENDKIQEKGKLYLDELPNGKHRGDVIAKMTEAKNQHDEITAKKEWDDFEKQIRALYSEKNIDQVLSNLSKRQPQDERWKKLCTEMLGQTTEMVKSKVESWGTQYDRIKDLIKQ